eukprot:CAMPEP_0171344022 /NCGR_PEP_ID=MMETSP0878-20121228/18495_1 /TAXON_ID=67004 /ORGANISM="Thalassiosira weissflogii, Strain CCMP1336" /LENGTH=64 /DNA_ID=CAMNT_0011847113 /DNA_START=198 /DNA_END=392 /DNA_ORIENTATION=-
MLWVRANKHWKRKEAGVIFVHTPLLHDARTTFATSEVLSTNPLRDIAATFADGSLTAATAESMA